MNIKQLSSGYTFFLPLLLLNEQWCNQIIYDLNCVCLRYSRLIMPTLSKMLVLVAGTVLGTEILWRLVCVWRRRLTTCSKGEMVEVLFFPDLPADLFFPTTNARKGENTFGANLSRVKRFPSISFFLNILKILVRPNLIPVLRIRDILVRSWIRIWILLFSSVSFKRQLKIIF
jgi:hypothetical protein